MYFALGRAYIGKANHLPELQCKVVPLITLCLRHSKQFTGFTNNRATSARFKRGAVDVIAGDRLVSQDEQGRHGKPGELAPSTPAEEAEEMIVLPPPRDAKVKTAKYVTSSVALSQCPPAKLPEFAVIGRSNVGKSSLINMLTGSKSLALTSKQPGKTMTINHFLINDSWYLVDLPGYGFAKKAISTRLEWSKFTQDYFLHRETLAMVFLLVDGSVPVQPLDIDCANWLADAKVPLSIVFTKIDKRKKRVPAVQENIDTFTETLGSQWGSLPVVIATSSETGVGRQELLGYISQLRQLFKMEQPALVLPNAKKV